MGNHCYFVRVPGEGILYEGVLYFDPQNPDTTACVHPQGAAADISPDARSGTSANCLAHEAFRTVSRNCLKSPRDAFIDYLFHLPSMVAALILAYCFFSLLWERSGSGHLRDKRVAE